MQNVDITSFDLNLLTSLEILLEECNVTNSARRLNMSQPSMSRTFARLRDAFDDPLLVRTSNGYIKTAKAEWLQNEIKGPLKSLKNVLAAPTYNPAFEIGTFVLATLDYGEEILVPCLWELIDEACEDVKLNIVARSMYSAKEIVDFEADISIGIMPRTSFQNCTFEPLFDERYVCVMCKDHPIANKQLTLDAFMSYGHSIVNAYTSQFTMIDDTLAAMGLKRKIKKQTSNFLAAHSSLKQTNLLLTTPARVAKGIQKAQNLVVKELPFEAEPVTIYQIWHIKNLHNKRHKWLRQQVNQVANKLHNVEKFS